MRVIARRLAEDGTHIVGSLRWGVARPCAVVFNLTEHTVNSFTLECIMVKYIT